MRTEKMMKIEENQLESLEVRFQKIGNPKDSVGVRRVRTLVLCRVREHPLDNPLCRPLACQYPETFKLKTEQLTLCGPCIDL
jgi:hypothetical protein